MSHEYGSKIPGTLTLSHSHSYTRIYCLLKTCGHTVIGVLMLCLHENIALSNLFFCFQGGKHQEYEQKLLQDLYKMNPTFLQTSAVSGDKPKCKSNSLQRYSNISVSVSVDWSIRVCLTYPSPFPLCTW